VNPSKSAGLLLAVFLFFSAVVTREVNASELCVAHGLISRVGSSEVYRGIFKGEAVAIVRASAEQQRRLSAERRLSSLSAKRKILHFLGEVRHSERQPEKYFEFNGFETYSASCSGTPYVVYVQPLSQITRVSRRGDSPSSKAAEFSKKALDDNLSLEEVVPLPNIIKDSSSKGF
jgi:hypothetical protein